MDGLLVGGVLGLPGAAIMMSDGRLLCSSDHKKLILAVANDANSEVDTVLIDNGGNLMVTSQGKVVKVSLKGDVDDFALWTRALTREEVRRIHDAGRKGHDLGSLTVSERACASRPRMIYYPLTFQQKRKLNHEDDVAALED